MADVGKKLVTEMFDSKRNIMTLLHLYTDECARYWHIIHQKGTEKTGAAVEGHV